MEIKVIEIRKDRPAEAPEGWRIFNAPRPLYGDAHWTGDFLTGCFYVAVDTDEPYADQYIRRNHDLDARELVYITQEEFDRRVDAYGKRMAEDYGVDLDEFEREDVIHSYQNWRRQNGGEVRW